MANGKKGNSLPKAASAVVRISPPDFGLAEFVIEGTAPLVQNPWTKKAREAMEAAQAAGSRGKKGKKRTPRDKAVFAQEFEEAVPRSAEDWEGFPAAAIRHAMISAGRLCGFKMTLLKLAVFVEPDGFKSEGTPLIRILKGKPQPRGPEPLPNADGSVDLRMRAQWDAGWRARVRIRFDRDQCSVEDVTNLLMRAGMQIGICAGRPDSRNSPGCGWGLFRILNGK